MHMRLFQPSDITAITNIHVECSRTDPLIRYFYKDLDKYPTSYHLGNWRFLRSKVLTVGGVTYVVETEPSDYAPGEQSRAPEVVAFAAWTRVGSSEAAKKWQASGQSWAAALDRGLMKVEDLYYKMFPTVQRTYDAKKSAEVAPYLRKAFDPEIFNEVLRLDLLFVHPDWQRRGLGKMLMRWGFDRAQEEKVPIVVGSSPRGGAVYRAVGFRSYKNMGMARFYNELEFGGETSQAWVWEPEIEEADGIQGNWFERAKSKAEQEQEQAEDP